MAPRRNIKAKDPVVKETPVMDGLGLESGDQVRFRRNDGEHWTLGRVRGDNDDGSLTIFDRDGRSRSIMPDKVQRKERGPRGGVNWVDVCDGVPGV